jgi:hypothetical protein
MKINHAFLESLVQAIDHGKTLDLMKTMRGCLREGVPLHVVLYLFGAARAVYAWDEAGNRIMVTGRGGLHTEARADAVDGHILISRLVTGDDHGRFSANDLKAILGVSPEDEGPCVARERRED